VAPHALPRNDPFLSFDQSNSSPPSTPRAPPPPHPHLSTPRAPHPPPTRNLAAPWISARRASPPPHPATRPPPPPPPPPPSAHATFDLTRHLCHMRGRRPRFHQAAVRASAIYIVSSNPQPQVRALPLSSHVPSAGTCFTLAACIISSLWSNQDPWWRPIHSRSEAVRWR
jgi:hypothetical protein